MKYILDTNGLYTATSVIDSDYIAGDTTINGLQYFNWVTNNSLGVFIAGGAVRDSLHYLVSSGGARIFSSQNFTDTFSTYYTTQSPTDTISFRFNKMEDPNYSVSVPAGNFVTHNSKTTYILYPPLSNSVTNPRELNLRYAKDVGLVYETLTPFTSDPNYRVKKLIRYHLN